MRTGARLCIWAVRWNGEAKAGRDVGDGDAGGSCGELLWNRADEGGDAEPEVRASQKGAEKWTVQAKAYPSG